MITIVVSMMIIYFSVFIICPLLLGMYGSLFNWNPLIGQFDFIGFKNYINLFKDKLFLPSLFNTFFFAAVVVIARIIIGLALAVAINSFVRSKSFFRSIYFMPTITSIFAISLVWQWLYDPTIGVYNTILRAIGLPVLRFLNDAKLALPSIMLMTIWKEYGFAMVLFLAGLTNIPKQFIEASYLDGANKIKSFWYITLPLLKPTMTFVAVISMISYLQTFTQIYVMTKGGPGFSTYTIVYMIYREAFMKFQFGYGSAIAVVLFIIIIILSLIQLKLMRTTWRY